MGTAVTGAVIVAVTMVWVGQNHSTPAPFGRMSAPQSSVTYSPDYPPPTVGTTPSATAGADSPTVPVPAPTVVAQAPATAQATAAAGAPVRVIIPALGIDAAVDEVLTGPNKVLRPPDDPSRVGWWIASSPPGASVGPTVIVGHVDSAAGGRGALFRLTDLQLGDQIDIRTTNNIDTGFSVSARSAYTKTTGLPPDLFALDGPARLVLITCGGAFDPDTASYEQNIVIVAEPSSG